MKILQLCNKPPFPATDGGCLAMVAIADGLMDAGHEVHVLAIHTPKHPNLPEKFPSAWIKRTQYKTKLVDTSINPFHAFLNLFQKESYNVSRFYTESFATLLKQQLETETYDCIHLESLYLVPYLPIIKQYSKAPVILRAHNIEHQLWERRTQACKGLKKWWFESLTKKLKVYESEALKQVDGIAAITKSDADFFKSQTQVPVETIAFAMPIPESNTEIAEPASIFHLGAMDWQPNSDGVRWLVHEVWPMVLNEIPTAKLHLAGRYLKTDDPAYKGKNVIIDGEVDDAHGYISRKSIQLIPLHAGGGMRVKLIEGMALQKAIITTSIGAEGVCGTSGKEFLIANDAHEFAKAIIQLANNPEQVKQLGHNARNFVQEQFERKKITEFLLQFYTRLIQHS
ncbi:MAG: glycosyltransferase family 4 protein [Bacteroidia bacterium]